ncbi:BREX-1 system phosphatase PglZ type A [Pseudomonas sp. IT-P253]|uniref:ABC-three component system middle component 1 n=1 Tax=Pseudomonas sp. IT-P253 TaxID=3026455 RepID=UPI0039E0B81E
MKGFLSELFFRHQYSEKLADGFSLFVPDDANKEAYWLVVESSPQTVIESQHLWLDTCRKLYRNPAVEKNTNLICIWSVQEINEKVISEVHAAEEDLFFFKKHVLYYTSGEMLSLSEKVGESNIADFIFNSVNNPEVFSSYKTLLRSGTWEELIYRIVIKLGFVDIGEGEAADIQGLYVRHNEKIKGTKQPELLSFIESSILNIKFDGSVSPESILNDLVEKIAEASYEVKY